jgi:Flp pilus assembly protein TadD
MRMAMFSLLLPAMLPLMAQQTPQEVGLARKEIQALWPRKDFAEAARRLERLARSQGFLGLSPLEQASIHYDLACAYARLDRRSEAIAFLGVAAGEGFH